MDTQPVRERRDLGQTFHVVTPEWTSATVPADRTVGHRIVTDAGTLTEAAANCNPCRAIFRGAPVPWWVPEDQR